MGDSADSQLKRSCIRAVNRKTSLTIHNLYHSRQMYKTLSEHKSTWLCYYAKLKNSFKQTNEIREKL